VGLAHFRAFPEPLLGQELGFLDDLFVPLAHRGQGTGRKLIEAVAAIARQRGWPVLRWITAQDNAAARRLYDQMARATPWVTYDLDVARH
ncbi:MAG: GNAT family N-acetyltransferase, partial [Comamonas sp.]